MILENQDNSEEYKLKKPENIYQEGETPAESAQENIESSIESEINQSEIKKEQFETNLAAVGGEEGIQKTWSEMDETRKKEIVSKIESFKNDSKRSNNKSKDMAIGAGLGTLLLACGVGAFATGGSETELLSGIDFVVGGILITLPTVFMTIKEKIRSLQYSRAANKEEQKLA